MCGVICAVLILNQTVLGDDHHLDASYQQEEQPHSDFTTSSHEQDRFLLSAKSFMTDMKSAQNKSTSNGIKLTPTHRMASAGAHSDQWISRSASGFDFNRDYFHQVNALNHKPIHQPTFSYQESHPKPSISVPPEIESQVRNQANIFYYSPSSYGKPSMAAFNSQLTSQPNTTQDKWLSTPPDDELIKQNLVFRENNSKSSKNGNQMGNKPVQWSIPLIDQSKLDETKSSKVTDRIDYPASYSGELNKLLLQKYYNRDLSDMTALLNKHTQTIQSTTNLENTRKQNLNSQIDAINDEEDEETDDDEEESGDDHSDRPIENVSVMNIAPKSDPNLYKPTKMNLLGEYKGRSGETVLRVHSPRMMHRPYPSRSMPVRLQGAHSHSMPHYYVPHGVMEGGVHHHLVSEKGSNWLGSGLAAGILIGAIPFGIMMASMMPTLLTTAMPIVNTATVAGKRRRRRSASEIKNLFMEQTLETLGVFLRKGIEDIVSQLRNPNSKYSPKNDVHVYENQNQSEENSVLKTMARYVIAAVDEPKCIKEMVCALVAGGRHSRTTPLQRTLFVITKW